MKHLNIFLIKRLLTWIYFGLWCVVVDGLLVGGCGWWWTYCGGGWWWVFVGGGIVLSNLSFKMGVLKSFAIFTGKHLCWSLFLTTLRTFFHKIPPAAASAVLKSL